ncbi:MAG TPA: ATP-dependent DNA helicase [Polyangiaceae bacterium]|nr:ATP-dependent DNA helicase [Polyangiaceae bacterium]
MSARELLDRDGPLARSLDGYEPRPGQLDMAAAVERAIDEDRLLICEAGTGTGKTLAYLVPALRAGRRVVISTASRALQEQIATADLPMALRCVDRKVRTRVVKGLGNYLCLRRFDELRHDVDRHPGLSAPLATVERWAGSTSRGDIAEVSELPEDHAIWRLVTSSSDTRVGTRCPHFDACHVTRMKREAEEADLLVVNHHLLLADLSLRGDHPGAVLPDYDALVIDEAHKLEDVATLFFGIRLSSAALERAIRDAGRRLVGPERTDAPRPFTDRALDRARQLFAALNLKLASSARAPLPNEAWSDELRDAYHALDDALDVLVRRLTEHEHPVLERSAARLERLRRDLADVAGADTEAITWLERRGEGLALTSAPVDVGPMLRDRLFGRGHAIVLTSASLTTDGGFEYLRGRLGLTEVPDTPIDELVVESSIDHQHQALLYTPTDLPHVDAPSFTESATARIADLHALTPGGAFVLCTSRRSMHALASSLERALPSAPLVQGEAPKATLLERFRHEGDAVLVATMSFWEGVDVPGRALALVVIDRIPFAVPTDPVVAARCAAVDASGRSSFEHYSLPRAAIVLKQGFGRLLRSRHDRGVVAVLDSRLSSRRYGERLVDSLPRVRRTRDLADVTAFWSELHDEPW